MTGTVEFIQKISYVEVPDKKGEMQTYAIPETDENVQELVRCKDCKWYSEKGFCKHPNGGAGNIRPADWFCADGERKSRMTEGR